jgi:hypothetical protein
MPTTPAQRIWQGRFEALIGLAAPALDLVLSAGDRASRLLLRDDADYYPIRPAEQAFELDDARRRRLRSTERDWPSLR